MGRYFDTSIAVATLATSATGSHTSIDLSQKSQLSQGVWLETNAETNIIDLRDTFEERAAIMEFDGEMTRDEAERLAALETGFSVDELNRKGTVIQTVDPSVAPGSRDSSDGSA